MKIVIPTYMREDNQKCYDRLPESIKKKVALYTHSGRAGDLLKNQPNARIVDTGPRNGIADVRQGILDTIGSGKVLIMDDGCTFKKRVDMKLVDMNEEDYEEMFAEVERLLDLYPMVGISDQAGNNRVEEDVKEIGRSYSCYGVNIDKFKEIGVRFDGMYQKNKEVVLYEDFYVILKLLTLGHKNAIIYKYAFNHPHGKKGGNSTIRTNAKQKQCLEALQNEFPGLVELVKKEDPSWKAGLNDEDNFRWEARIAWKKAYDQSSQSDLSGFFA